MPGIVSLTTSTNLPARGGGLSVTADAQASDNRKTREQPAPSTGCRPLPNESGHDARPGVVRGVAHAV